MTSRSGLMGQVSTVVVKVGTSSITRGGRTVSTEFMDSVAEQVRKVRETGRKVLLVKNNRKNPQTASNNTPSTGKIKDVDF